MLTDFQILQHGPGQEDAPWPYEAQLYFARQIEAEVRKQYDALIRQMLEALQQADYNHLGVSAAITAAYARLGEKEGERDG